MSKIESPEGFTGRLSFDEPMCQHTTFGIGGRAKYLLVPKNLGDLKIFVAWSKRLHFPIYVVGNGSKLLVSDSGLEGLVIKMSGTLNSIKIVNETVFVGAGCTLSRLLNIAIKNRLTGLEFLAGIPGTVGGAIVMNAGTNLGSISQSIDKVTVFNMENEKVETLNNRQCHFSYRESIFQKNSNCIIISAELSVMRGDEKLIVSKINDLLEKRKFTQPLDKLTAGSIFKNSEKYSAGALIDSVGLKGFKVGNAKISEKHANFIINLGKASSEDVSTLIKLMHDKVKARYNVDLQPEVISFK